MILLHSRQRSLIIVLLLFGAIGSIAWYGIRPLQHLLAEKRTSIQEFYVDKENRERQIARLPELKEYYDTIIENEHVLDILITEDETVDFVKILERIAVETNVTMEITSKDGGKIIERKKTTTASGLAQKTDAESSPKKNGDSEEKTVLDLVPFERYFFLNIGVVGQYPNIIAFLGKVETLPFGLDVIKVEMSEQDDKNALPPTNTANPFAVSGIPIDPVTPLTETRNTIEAFFDVVVYVKK